MKKSKAVAVKSKTKKTVRKAAKTPKKKASTLFADNRLLEVASQQYTRLLKELSRRKKKLSQDKQVAIEIGERILAKAKEVSSTLVRK